MRREWEISVTHMPLYSSLQTSGLLEIQELSAYAKTSSDHLLVSSDIRTDFQRVRAR